MAASSRTDRQLTSRASYTMMGTADDKGIIPRLCDALFERIVRLENESTAIKVEVSYMEIYNEKVHDLLDLKGLSSRSHAVFNIIVTQTLTDLKTSVSNIRVM
ncbi:hypothetical protein DPMN_069961 [Dreissena polymorpha]|uniref:Kinesin motor domain-containing protein n=1 Tax=Dreissena polymorpha TaxID=45954 RepID=A0A9D4BVB8_DREPO|nr:hypothetical protein DPMN_069961 [Dreissena polymorpha]